MFHRRTEVRGLRQQRDRRGWPGHDTHVQSRKLKRLQGRYSCIKICRHEVVLRGLSFVWTAKNILVYLVTIMSQIASTLRFKLSVKITYIFLYVTWKTEKIFNISTFSVQCIYLDSVIHLDMYHVYFWNGIFFRVDIKLTQPILFYKTTSKKNMNIYRIALYISWKTLIVKFNLWLMLLWLMKWFQMNYANFVLCFGIIEKCNAGFERKSVSTYFLLWIICDIYL